MRQVFSSARIENVEAVARLLEEAGIEVRVSNGRSYRGAIRGNFSYREGSRGGPSPAVWVVRSDQQPEARNLLREAGLLQDAPWRGGSYLPPSDAPARSAAAPRGAGRGRYLLLAAVAVVAALAMFGWRAGRDHDAAPAATATATASAQAAPTLDGVPELATLPDEAFVIATPSALAATLLRSALATAGETGGCLSVDDADPDPDLLQELAAGGLDVAPASSCPDGRLLVAVSGYTTDGSGAGTVRLAVGGDAPRTIAVRREGRDWHRDEAP